MGSLAGDKHRVRCFINTRKVNEHMGGWANEDSLPEDKRVGKNQEQRREMFYVNVLCTTDPKCNMAWDLMPLNFPVSRTPSFILSPPLLASFPLPDKLQLPQREELYCVWTLSPCEHTAAQSRLSPGQIKKQKPGRRHLQANLQRMFSIPWHRLQVTVKGPGPSTKTQSKNPHSTLFSLV